jgi:ABC-type transport system involved in multi-copper enzyme maturation permease subunit
MLALGVVGGAVAAGFFAGAMTVPQQVLLWMLLAPALAFVLRPAWQPLLGPVVFYDLIRAARRGRHVLFRCLYAGILLVLLYLLYLEIFGNRSGSWIDVLLGIRPTVPMGQMQQALSRFTDRFFQQFMYLQFVTVVLLTPALTTSAISEEKERRTLEFLLATDLGSPEIVLGKLVSRLAYMSLLILTGLPILGLLQLLGGIDPELVLLGYAATGVTMLSLASLSILNSVYAGKPRTAIFLTYVEVAVYGLVSGVAGEIGGPPGSSPIIDWFCGGNIYMVLEQLVRLVAGGRGGAGGFAAVFRDYLIFHGVATLLCLVAAVSILRAWAKRQMAGRGRKAFRLALGQKRLPRVGNNPMRWKELYAEPLLRLGSRMGVTVIGTFVTVCLLFGAFVFICIFVVGQAQGDVKGAMNNGIRVVGTAGASLLLLGVAVRAASAVASERERDTLDSLLATPLESSDILWSKHLGSMLATRRVWWYLGAMWVAGVCTGGLHPLGLVHLLAAWAIYAAFFASLGLWFSVTCRTLLRSVIWTLLTTFVLTIGNWLLLMCCLPLFMIFTTGPGSRMSLGSVQEILALGVSPPWNLWFLAYPDFPERRLYEEYRYWQYGASYYPGFWERLGVSFAGLMCYGLAAVLLWFLAKARFDAKIGRSVVAHLGRRPHRQ